MVLRQAPMKKLATIKRLQVKGKNFRIYGFEHRDGKGDQTRCDGRS